MSQHRRGYAATVLPLRLPAFAVNFATQSPAGFPQSPAEFYNVFDTAIPKTVRGI